MQTRQLTVQCEGGLHLRVAAQIVKQAQRHQAKVQLRCEGCPFASACSVFELLRLGAAKGTAVEIVADGPDEESALQALCELFGGGAGI
ncbi:MAG TPA: HPr family phosphocarrier protein [Kiritimatiellia bacterium]|nr:HPr family phosphocarrier protein [Kiritimatiellia bacterium]